MAGIESSAQAYRTSQTIVVAFALGAIVLALILGRTIARHYQGGRSLRQRASAGRVGNISIANIVKARQNPVATITDDGRIARVRARSARGSRAGVSASRTGIGFAGLEC